MDMFRARVTISPVYMAEMPLLVRPNQLTATPTCDRSRRDDRNPRLSRQLVIATVILARLAATFASSSHFTLRRRHVLAMTTPTDTSIERLERMLLAILAMRRASRLSTDIA